MKSSIKHQGEIRGNAIRKRLDKVVGLGQRTYTPSELAVDRAKGCNIYTVDGKRLIDFTSGVLVANLGHAHAGFEKRCKQYTAALPRNAYNMVTAIEAEAAERVIKSLSYPRAQKLLWAASGSEGIQKAMWAALHRHPDRPIMVATRGGFHGKKGLAGDVTGDKSVNRNVKFISFPMKDVKPKAFYQAELDELAKKYADRIALLITEPYLGAKGSFHPPKWYHKMLQRWCRKHDIAFIFDEVQACHGRTGNMYAFESYGVEPDLVVLGKGLGNGEPAAAAVGRADLVDALHYGEASDTFSGNPRACAAVCATFDVFKSERVVANCQRMAPIMLEGLLALKDRFSFVKDIRGEGLVYGVEIADPGTANRCVLEAYRGNGKAGVHFLGPLAEKVLRVSPPLIITEKEVANAFGIIEKTWARI
ncbi:MAG: aminotransferase class III-fold pyridoxal phosphate-dependent enzyme [Nitrospiraceae bacterium]|nr:aminotransferase class III-fold pyridoxal phosphate-dependent enzyme [Nitrospiraceae bacterium]